MNHDSWGSLAHVIHIGVELPLILKWRQTTWRTGTGKFRRRRGLLWRAVLWSPSIREPNPGDALHARMGREEQSGRIDNERQDEGMARTERTAFVHLLLNQKVGALSRSKETDSELHLGNMTKNGTNRAEQRN